MHGMFVRRDNVRRRARQAEPLTWRLVNGCAIPNDCTTVDDWHAKLARLSSKERAELIKQRNEAWFKLYCQQ